MTVAAQRLHYAGAMKLRLAIVVLLSALAANAQQFEGVNASIVRGRFLGREGVHLAPEGGGDMLAILSGSEMRDGVIDVDVAGNPLEGAPEGARGFIGIAFRVRPKAATYECFYIRPTNGRADDQLRRNHSTQYISFPDYPWDRLRKEAPGVYESYADMEPGKWMHLRVVVEGQKARLFVNGADQPALVVNDLKLGTAGGAVALWAVPTTDAWFSGLKVRSAAAGSR